MDPYTAAINAGLSPALAAYMPRYVQIESGGNPNSQTGKYSGLLQMGPDEQTRYGGNGLTSGAKMYADNANWFSSKYGRAPTPTELYLAAQQGQGGLSAHLANPDAPAWQNMASTAEGRQKGEGWAKQAIWGNVPNDIKAQFPNGVDGLTSQQFINDVWKRKVERTPMSAAFNQGQDSTMPQVNPMAAAMAGGDQPSDGGGFMNAIFPGGSMANVGSALAGAGAGLISINNPMGGAMLQNAATQRLTGLKPQWGVIGQDMFGQPKYGWINPYNQSITPYTGGAAGGGSGASQGGMEDTLAKIQTAANNGASKEEITKMLPTAIQGDLTAMLDNRAIPYNLSRQGPMRNLLLMAAHAADPNFDESKLPGRVDFQKKLAGGSLTTIGGQKQSVGTALEHLGGVADSAADIGNTNGLTGLDMEARAENMVRNSTVSQAAKVNALDNWADKYAGEVGRLYSGTQGGGVAERQASRNRFGGNMSPQSLAAGLEAEVGLLQGKYNQMQAQADDMMGPGKVKIIGPAQEAAIAKINARIAQLRGMSGGGSKEQSLPQGVTSINVIGSE